MEDNLKILIVDDIFVNRLLIREIVKKIGALCKEAENGKQAIDLLNNENFDVILMDIEMPVMNGLETTKFIRAKLPKHKSLTPIVALTAHDPMTFFNDYKDVGFDQLMVNHTSIDKVLSVIQDVTKKKIE